MTDRLAAVPFFVVIMAAAAAAMLVPSLHALARDDYATSRIFFYGSILGGVLTLLIAIATTGRRHHARPRSQLAALVGAFTILPAYFALPMAEALPRSGFFDAWFEMVSSFTTTGATIYETEGRLNPSLHLWRALVGWLGGLLVWIVAVAILAPMSLGGFEVRSAIARADGAPRFVQISRVADPSERLVRYGAHLLPIYAGLTAALWIGLLVMGEIPIVAICHAMSVLSTSGISPIDGTPYGASGLPGEAVMFVFFVFALSRQTFSRGMLMQERTRLSQDPELGMALAIALSVPTLLFLRHFLGAAEGAQPGAVETNAVAAMRAFWGTLFTVVSFLTTTGFESVEWLDARDWSGLETPGLILVGVALIGGGVATTAGGVKLLRVYALWMHGRRELDRLLHPHSVGGLGPEARRIRRQGAYIAWLFFMLFALSITVIMLALSMTGVQFETAMVLAVSALSTCGPLAGVAAESPISYDGIPDGAKAVLAAAMVLGRLETLALIALLNPATWRR